MSYQNTANMHHKKPKITVNMFIRSLLVSIITSITIVLYSFVCVVFFLFPLRYRHGLIRSYLRLHIYLLKVICHVNYQVEGLENIPKDRTGIILSKHQSTWETFFLPLIFHEPAIILKRELLWIPFFGWGLASMDPIAINRNNQKTALQQIIEKGRKCLENGRFILVFPEGTRIMPGKIGQYKIGGARLAVGTHHPVIPVAHNAGRFWHKGQFVKTPGTIRMVIGPLIETTGRTPDEVLHLAKTWIEDKMLEIEHSLDFTE
jgi:1-acyl-sn-glycerol-3-phosphate acyltransferase